VDEVIGWFRQRGTTTVDTVTVVDEDVEFLLPSSLARAMASAENLTGPQPSSAA
jgi:hypothetical protein